jgi:signal transduction histidine kinase
MPDTDIRTGPTLQRVVGRIGSGWVTAVVVFVALGGTVFGVDAANLRNDLVPLAQPWAVVAEVSAGVGYLGALTVPFVLVLRRRAPERVTFWLVGLAFVMPLSPVPAALALASLTRRRTGAVVWQAVGLHSALVAWFLVWDLRGPTTETSALRAVIAPPGAAPTAAVPVSAAQLVITALVLVVAPVVVGLYLRSREQLGESRRRVELEQQASGTLAAQVGRQAERELIAREVHDVIGHRLSLLSLHAGGLEVAASGDPRLARSAALVRQSAQQTMDDLRSLVTMLRDPDDRATQGLLDGAPTSLADLPRVVDETLTAGRPIASSVYLSHAEEADPALARAVYRIVQELLTNAHRHAPDEPVRLSVRGGPDEGIRIETTNRVGPGPSDEVASRGGGSGLVGIRERAEILGGVLEVCHDDGLFRAEVRLPWVTAPAPRHASGRAGAQEQAHVPGLSVG